MTTFDERFEKLLSMVGTPYRMFDDNGNLKWIYKQYYKQTRKSPTGYKLVKEYNKEHNKED